VAEELDRLEAVGLLDDGRFAQEFAEHELDRRLSGRRAVAEGLASKGIDRATIARVLAEIPGDEEERAARLAATRATSLRGLSREVAFRRLMSFLVRRGHDPELARRVCRTVLGADQDG
jgi:regulatory protein